MSATHTHQFDGHDLLKLITVRSDDAVAEDPLLPRIKLTLHNPREAQVHDYDNIVDALHGAGFEDHEFHVRRIDDINSDGKDATFYPELTSNADPAAFLGALWDSQVIGIDEVQAAYRDLDLGIDGPADPRSLLEQAGDAAEALNPFSGR